MGLSQEGLAERLGVHRTYVGGVERGERNLTLRTVERWSAELGLEPLDLFYEEEGIGISLDPSQRQHPDRQHTDTGTA